MGFCEMQNKRHSVYVPPNLAMRLQFKSKTSEFSLQYGSHCSELDLMIVNLMTSKIVLDILQAALTCSELTIETLIADWAVSK